MRRLDDSSDRDEIAPPKQAKGEGAAAATAPVPSAERAQGLAAGSLEGAKQSMGAAFGTDFSGVEISQDGRAEAMGAQAFTQGDHVHLAAGRGDPSTREGNALLGHELAHVQQQRAGRVAAPQAKGGAINADAGLEHEADVAGAAAARGDAVPSHLHGELGGGAGAAQAKAEGQPIQMFGSLEHQVYGNDGAHAAGYDGVYTPGMGAAVAGKPAAPARFELTHGDIVMLSGDYFDPRDKDENGAPVADNFFKLCNTPSSAPGTQLGTQDEIMCAVHHAHSGDHRFLSGPVEGSKDPMFGNWANIKFSDAVKESVNNRYLRLASANWEHFAAPRGPKSAGPGAGNRGSAGGSYRALHEDALLRARDAKKAGLPIGEPMAHEAAAEHFLTDGFAAGHLRTPRQDIANYWRAKYPLFFENLKKTIAQDVAIWINREQSNWATRLGSVLDIMGPILEQVDAATASLPAVGFDAIVGDIAHDIDNVEGLWVQNDIGNVWQTFGDSHGGVKDTSKPEQAATRSHVELSVKLGVQDVQHAYALPADSTDEHVKESVRSSTPAPGKTGQPKYGPEQIMPKEVDGANGQQKWQVANFQDLVGAHIRSDRANTYGGEIIKSMTSGDFGEQLDALAEKFPDDSPVNKTLFSVPVPQTGPYGTPSMGSAPVTANLGTLHPKQGYKQEFLAQMKAPGTMFGKIQRIIDYDPARGQNSTRDDDATRQDMDRLEKQGREMQGRGEKDTQGRPADENTQLRGLTLTQRAEYVKNLESFKGWTTTDNEQEKMVRLFDTAPASDRRPLYRLVEGHEWRGEFKHGWTVSNDDLWNDLSRAHLDHLEALLNASP